jgi:glycosyltransferase involved in cell wall biosynthesis
MKVFLAVKSLSPSYGGPAFSVSRLAVALADAGIDIGLWSDDLSGAKPPLLPSHPRIQLLAGNVTGAIRRFDRPDIVHDNGIWLPHNHRLATLGASLGLPRVVSTRGMLEPWAVSHKRVKKKLAWWLYQRRDLSRASYHHTTAEQEAENLRLLKLGVPIGVIRNGVNVVEANIRRRDQSEWRHALFLGRIHPVKGLTLLLDAWAQVRPRGWRLQIAGPDEVGHRAELEDKISTASLANVVRFLGPLDGAAKEKAFAGADLFVLPSFSESFGMAIGEALAHGVPVLTTSAVPWPMLAGRGCGWSVAPSVDGLTGGLRVATALGPDALFAMGEKGRELVRQDFSWSGVAKQFIATYETLLSRRNLN